MRLLLTYTSRNGATEGIAARMATKIAKSGIDLDLRRVEETDDLIPFDAFLLGAPVYDQAWPEEAEDFVFANFDTLASHPLWLFSVGSFGDTNRILGRLVRKEPRHIRELCAGLEPRDYRVFRGVIEKEQWPFWSRVLFHFFGGRFGDHREWHLIDAWADQIAKALKR